MLLSPMLIILFPKNNIFVFFNEFQIIFKLKPSSMTVLIEYNCSNTSWYPFRLHVSISLKTSSNYDKFMQKFLPFHNQWKIWTASLHLILRLWSPKLARNCTMGCCIKSYLHIVGTIIFLVVMSSWIIRNYPYPKNNEILEMLRNVKSACNSLVHGNDTFYCYYLCIMFQMQCDYCQISNISGTLVGNKLVDRSDVVGASSVGTAPTTSSFLTWYLASIDCTKVTARWDKKHLTFGIWCNWY